MYQMFKFEDEKVKSIPRETVVNCLLLVSDDFQREVWESGIYEHRGNIAALHFHW